MKVPRHSTRRWMRSRTSRSVMAEPRVAGFQRSASSFPLLRRTPRFDNGVYPLHLRRRDGHIRGGLTMRLRHFALATLGAAALVALVFGCATSDGGAAWTAHPTHFG